MDHQPAAGPARAHRLSVGPRRPTAPAQLAAVISGRALAAGGLVLCSDFDGTLAPIVHTPDEAHALPAAAAAMRWLSRDGARHGRAAACATLAAVVTARD